MAQRTVMLYIVSPFHRRIADEGPSDGDGKAEEKGPNRGQRRSERPVVTEDLQSCSIPTIENTKPDIRMFFCAAEPYFGHYRISRGPNFKRGKSIGGRRAQTTHRGPFV